MRTKDDEIQRSKRIAHQLERLGAMKREQDAYVSGLMARVSAWQLEHAEIAPELRAVFAPLPVGRPPETDRPRAVGALRG